MAGRIPIRWVAALAASLLILVFAVSGTGHTANGSAPVRIVDTTNPNVGATVDTNGDLHVAGSLTLDNSDPIHVTSTDDPGRLAFHHIASLLIPDNSNTAAVVVDVPDPYRLEITDVSSLIRMPIGQDAFQLILESTAGFHAMVPVSSGTIGGTDRFVASEDTLFFADDEVVIEFDRSDTTNIARATVGINGYLIDCGAAACSANS